MNIKPVTDPSFRRYGQLLAGYDFAALIKALGGLPVPEDRVVYKASCPTLEATAAFGELTNRHFGGMPVQIGYCAGKNSLLNCLEYHRDSEVNVFATDAVLLVGLQEDITPEFTYDTAKVEAFSVRAGMAVELFATALHYAPCGNRFNTAVVLPRGTNTEKPAIAPASPEDRLLFARNKWLLALPGTGEAADGAHVGLTGGNIDIADML